MGREYVGIDFHRRRSVVVRMSPRGKRLSVVRIDNSPAALAAAVCAAGDRPQVVLEATYGWYWAVDVLQELGATVHLANPNALNWGERRVKNDVIDATDLADMLRLGRLPEAWIAPPALRELREVVRYRAKLVQLRAGLKAQVHAVMAKEGVLPSRLDMFGPGGQVQLDEMGLGHSYRVRVESLRDLIKVYDAEIVMLERDIHRHLRHHSGYQAVQAINGSGARSRRSSSLRSVTSPGSPAHAICARGPDSLRVAESPTSKATTKASPSTARRCCAGRSSRASPATTAGHI